MSDPKPHMGGLTLMRNVPAGHCPECACKHEPWNAHNQQSLFYQYAFFEDHGRWPTWKDAMHHCTPEVKQQWIAGLKKHGIEVEP